MFRNSSFAWLVSYSCARLAPLTFIMLILASSACSRYNRTKQCRALIAQVNPALDDVLTITQAGGHAGAAGAAKIAATGGVGGASGSASVSGNPTESHGYVAAAGRYERLAKQLGPMQFASEDMAKLVAEYVGVLHSAAVNLRSLAAALDSMNYSEAERLNRELERIGGHERSLINRMDAWCAPGS